MPQNPISLLTQCVIAVAIGIAVHGFITYTTFHQSRTESLLVSAYEDAKNAEDVNTAYDYIRSQYDIGIGYSDDIEEARQMILETMQGIEGVVSDPAPDVRLFDLAESAVNLRARWWTDSRRADVVAIQDRVLAAIKEALFANGVDLPYPTQVVLFHDQTEETDGDRRRQREGWPAGKGDVPKPRKIADVLVKLGDENGSSDREQPVSRDNSR